MERLWYAYAYLKEDGSEHKRAKGTKKMHNKA